MSKKLAKAAVNYRKAPVHARRRCKTCVMFRLASNSCTLVQGVIRSGDVCDRWEAK